MILIPAIDRYGKSWTTEIGIQVLDGLYGTVKFNSNTNIQVEDER